MSAFYTKNVPPLERALRLLVSLAMIVVAIVALTEPWRPIIAGGAAMLALTGMIGFCPACAAFGRTLGSRT